MGLELELFKACEHNDIEKVKLLLDSGVNINAGNYDWCGSCGPLSTACLFGHEELVKLLLDRNADVSNEQTGDWVFCSALESGNYNIVKLIAEKEEPHVILSIIEECKSNGEYTPITNDILTRLKYI